MDAQNRDGQVRHLKLWMISALFVTKPFKIVVENWVLSPNRIIGSANSGPRTGPLLSKCSGHFGHTFGRSWGRWKVCCDGTRTFSVKVICRSDKFRSSDLFDLWTIHTNFDMKLPMPERITNASFQRTHFSTAFQPKMSQSRAVIGQC